MINPIDTTRDTPRRSPTYKVEPYVVAADVYARRAARRPRRLDLVHRLGRLDVPADRRVAARPRAAREPAAPAAAPTAGLAGLRGAAIASAGRLIGSPAARSKRPRPSRPRSTASPSPTAGSGWSMMARATRPSSRRGVAKGRARATRRHEKARTHAARNDRSGSHGREHGAAPDAQGPRLRRLRPAAGRGRRARCRTAPPAPRRSPSWSRSCHEPRAIWLMVPAAVVDRSSTELVAAPRAGRHRHRRRQLLLPRRHPPRRGRCARRASTTSTSAPAAASRAWSAATA